MHSPTNPINWALILGGSSGIGLATAQRLARDGFSICIIHRDRKGAMQRIEADFADIRNHAPAFFSLNVDALDPSQITRLHDMIKDKLGPEQKIRLFLHSIAYGNLKPLTQTKGSPTDTPVLEDEDMVRTVYAMGTSLLTWVQNLHRNALFAPDARILGLTSEGNTIAWRGYAAVSAAKATLESLARSIAVEYAPFGIRCNILQPGVTDTPALRLIPGHEAMIASAKKRNPYSRLTTPEDVANVVSLLSRDEAGWINGALIHVDGGEHLAAS